MREDNHVHVVENVEVEIKKRSKKKKLYGTHLLNLAERKKTKRNEEKKKNIVRKSHALFSYTRLKCARLSRIKHFISFPPHTFASLVNTQGY